MPGTAVAIISSSILRTCGHQQFHEVALRPPVNLTSLPGPTCGCWQMTAPLR